MDLDLCKLCYEYEESINWIIPEKLKSKFYPNELMEEYNLNFGAIYEYAYFYLVNMIDCHNPHEYIEMKRKETINARFMHKNDVCYAIIAEPKQYLRFEYIEYGKVGSYDILAFSNHFEEDKREAAARKLKACLDEYKAYKAEKRELSYGIQRANTQKRKEKELDALISKSMEIMMPYVLNGSYDIDVYCKQSGTDPKVLNDAMTVLRRKAPEKYAFFEEKNNQKFLEKYAYLTPMMDKIIDLINTPVNDNGVERPFDIIDYYKVLGVDLRILGKFNQLTIPNPKRANITRFISINYKKELEPEDLDNILHNISFVYDDYELSEEEKMALYNELVELNVPISNHSIKLMFRHYAIEKLARRVK